VHLQTVTLPLQLEAHIFLIGATTTEDDMTKPESISELHRLGGFVNDQHDGRKDQPVTGAELYNLAVQLDSNFASLRSEIGNLRTEMNAEFSSLRSEMTSEFKAVRSEMNAEFKAVRAEMAEGFAKFQIEISRIPIKTAAWVATTMIALVGVSSALVAAVIAII